MSLDITLYASRPCPHCGKGVASPQDNFSVNITHNLTKMADACGLYKVMWRPEEIGAMYASQALPRLEEGIAKLEKDPGFFKAFNPPNGWGSYEGLLRAAKEYLEACLLNPDGIIEVSR